MDNIYMLPDPLILKHIGEHLKATRLKQNISQENLAIATDVSLSSIKKIEKGEIRSFDSFLRVIRILGKLDVLYPLVEEEKLSPSEYYELEHSIKARHKRKRASGKMITKNKEESVW